MFTSMVSVFEWLRSGCTNLLYSPTLKELDVSIILQSKQRGHLKYIKNNQVLKVAQMFYSTNRNTNSETISQKGHHFILYQFT